MVTFLRTELYKGGHTGHKQWSRDHSLFPIRFVVIVAPFYKGRDSIGAHIPVLVTGNIFLHFFPIPQPAWLDWYPPCVQGQKSVRFKMRSLHTDRCLFRTTCWIVRPQTPQRSDRFSKNARTVSCKFAYATHGRVQGTLSGAPSFSCNSGDLRVSHLAANRRRCRLPEIRVAKPCSKKKCFSDALGYTLVVLEVL